MQPLSTNQDSKKPNHEEVKKVRDICKTTTIIQNQLLKSNYWATDQDIFLILTGILRTPTGMLSANIIHPGHSGISPFTGGTSYATHIKNYLAGDLSGYEQKADLTLPTIMVVNNAGYKKSDVDSARLDIQARNRLRQSGGSHWTLCIHLPANYGGHLGGARLIYMDSYYSRTTFPNSIETQLISSPGAPFAGAEPIVLSTRQQVDPYGCGFFAAYYAITLVLNSNLDRLKNLPKDNGRNFEGALRTLFAPFIKVDLLPTTKIRKSLTVLEQRDLIISACLNKKEVEYEQLLDCLLTEEIKPENLLEISKTDPKKMIILKNKLKRLLSGEHNIYDFLNDQPTIADVNLHSSQL